MRNKVVVCLAFALSCLAARYLVLASRAISPAPPRPAPLRVVPGSATQGELKVIDHGGAQVGSCPLEHTDVKAEISGFLSRVTVTQQFRNDAPGAIEAVYTFPLPHDAAVDRMTMRIGDRTIEGKIMRKDEARALYDAARRSGRTAGLLDQQRPNIFTQSVANIPPGEHVDITISYAGPLRYEDGSYQFVFPMVVAPRYIPADATAQRDGWVPDTSRVPDASRIAPPVAAPDTRAGHDISIQVDLDAGVPLAGLRSTQHEVDVENSSPHSAVVRLKDEETIPNRDFILDFDVAGGRVEDAVIAHRVGGQGYFTLLLQPPGRPAVEEIASRELVFVLDTSGSMSGFPIEKAKETMQLALDGMSDRDTFNIITFAGDTHILFPVPVPATPENRRRAKAFLASRSGGGGTEMMQAIRTALEPSDYQDRVRVVCFMTDGEVGNDMEIISEVQKHPNARVFSFGIGSSVNRFLLDKIAEEGRGEAQYVTLRDDGSAAARRFHERIRNPLLTDISIDWGGLQVTEMYPSRIPDVFGQQPVVVCGRYASPGSGVVRVRGRSGGVDVVREISVVLPDEEPRNEAIEKFWARRRVDELMRTDWSGIQRGAPRDDVREAITQVGLQYGLVTQFTSFVAVDERIVTEGGVPRRVEVPVETPEGMDREDGAAQPANTNTAGYNKLSSDPSGVPAGVADGWPDGVPGGVYGGVPGGVPGGVAGGAPVDEPMPPPALSSPASRANEEAKADATPRVVRISGGVLAAKAILKPQPAYPEMARAAGITGTVVVEVTIDESGRVIAARVVSGHPLLRDACVQAARKWTFQPLGVEGAPVRIIGTITFTLPKR